MPLAPDAVVIPSTVTPLDSLGGAVRTFDDPINNAENEQQRIASMSQFGRGWESSGLGDQAGALFAQANHAYQNGDVVGAQVLEQQARDIQQKAAAVAPTVQSFTDIHDVGSAADWAGGSLGQLRSSVAPAVGGLVGAGLGAAVGGPIGGRAGMALGARIGGSGLAALAGGNMEYNEQMANGMSDPNIRATRSMEDIDKAAWVKGMINAGLEAYVPWAMTKGLIGLSADTVKKAAAETIAKEGRLALVGGQALKASGQEFATEGTQNIVGQGTQNWLKNEPLTNIDPKAAFNDAMAGAIGGGVMGAAGGVGQAIHASPGDTVQKPSTLDKVTETIGKGVQKAGELYQKGDETLQTWADNDKYKEMLGGNDYKGFTGNLDTSPAGLDNHIAQASRFADNVVGIAPSLKDADIGKAAAVFKGEMATGATISENPAERGQPTTPDSALFKFRKTVRELHKLDEQTKKFSNLAAALEPKSNAKNSAITPMDSVTDSKVPLKQQEAFMEIFAKKFNKAFPVASANASNQRAIGAYTDERTRALKALFNFAKMGFHLPGIDDEGTTKPGLPNKLQDLLGDDAGNAVETLAKDMEKQGWLWGPDYETGLKLADELKNKQKFDTEFGVSLRKRLASLGQHEFMNSKPEFIMSKLVTEHKEGKLKMARLQTLFGKHAKDVKAELSQYEKQSLGGEMKKDKGQFESKEDKFEQSNSDEGEVKEGRDQQHEIRSTKLTNVTYHTFGGKQLVNNNAPLNKANPDKYAADLKEAGDALRQKHGYAPDIQEQGVVDARHESLTRQLEQRIDNAPNEKEKRLLKKQLKHLRSVAEKEMLEKHGKAIGYNGEQGVGRVAAIKKINDQFKVMHLELNADEDAIDIKKEDIPKYHVDLNLEGENATIKSGAIFLQQKLTKNSEGGKKGDPAKTPFGTLVGRLLAMTGEVPDSHVTDKEGIQAIKHKVLAALTGIINAAPEKFTGRIGIIKTVGEPIHWLNDNGKFADQLPDDFTYLRGMKPVTEEKMKSDFFDFDGPWSASEFNLRDFRAMSQREQAATLAEMENRLESDIPMEEADRRILENAVDEFREDMHQGTKDFMSDPINRPFPVTERVGSKQNQTVSTGPAIRSLMEVVNESKPINVDQDTGAARTIPRLSNTQAETKTGEKVAGSSQQERAEQAFQNQKKMNSGRIRRIRKEVMQFLNKGIPNFTQAVAKIDKPDSLYQRIDKINEIVADDAYWAAKMKKLGKEHLYPLSAGEKKLLESAKRVMTNRITELGDVDYSKRMEAEAQQYEAAKKALVAKEDARAEAAAEHAKKPPLKTILQSDEQLAKDSTKAEQDVGAKNNTVAREKIEDTEFLRAKGDRMETAEQKEARLKAAKEKARNTPAPTKLEKELSENAKNAVDTLDQNDIRAYAFAGGRDVAAAMMDGLLEAQNALPSNRLKSPRAAALKKTIAWLDSLTSEEKIIQVMHDPNHIGSLKRARTILNTMIENSTGDEKAALTSRRDNIVALGKELLKGKNPVLTNVTSVSREELVREGKIRAFIKKILGDRAPVEHEVNDQYDEDLAAEDALASIMEDEGKYSRMEGVFPISREVIAAAEKGDFEAAEKAFEKMTQLFKSGDAKTDKQFERARQAFSVARDRLMVAKNNAAKSTPQRAAAMLQEIKRTLGIANSEMSAAVDQFDMTPEEKKEFKEYHQARFGELVKASFAKKGLTDNLGVPISGQWTDKMIRVSLFAKDPMGTYDHESMHQLFQYLREYGGEKTIEIMERVAKNPMVRKQLETLLRDEPGARKQLDNPEEAAAYIFQFWNARDEKGNPLINLGPETKSWFGKIVQVIREILSGVKTEMQDQYKMMQVMMAFNDGAWSVEPDAATKIITKKLVERGEYGDMRDTISDGIAKNPILQKFLFSNWAVLKDTKNPYLIGISKQFATITGNKQKEEPFLAAKRRELNQRLNTLAAIYKDMSEKDMDAINEYMVKGTDINKIGVQHLHDAVKATRKFLGDMHDYAVEAGVKRYDPDTHQWKELGFIKQNYAPINWDTEFVTEHVAEFVEDLKKYHMVELKAIVQQAEEERASGKITEGSAAANVEAGTPITVDDVANAIVNKIISSAGTGEPQESGVDIGITPYAKAVEKRTLGWIDHSKFTDYISKDWNKTITSYTTQMIKRAESVRRFGNDATNMKLDIDRAYAYNLLGDEKLVKEAEEQFQKTHGDLLEKYGYSKDRSEHHSNVMATLLQKETSELKADMKAREARMARVEDRLANMDIPSHNSLASFMSSNMSGEEARAEVQELLNMMESEQLEINDELARRKAEGDDTRVKVEKRSLRGIAESMLTGTEEEKAEKIAQARKDMVVPLKAIQALEGTLGADISPGVQTALQAITAYQHARILMTGLFSSFIDPAGLLVNGSTMKQAFAAFVRGIKAVKDNWMRNPEQMDYALEAAIKVGTVAPRSAGGAIGEAYGNNFTGTGLIGRINDAVFDINGMEAFTRAMRIQGTEAGIGFIERHLMNPNEHSARRLEELGLGPDQKASYFGADGRLDLDRRDVQMAVNRWVDDAILNPNASHRPINASDPHYQLFYSLKQFTYTFHNTILRRVGIEMREGNYAPLVQLLATTIPIMIGADAIKALMMPGEPPAWMRSLPAMLQHGFERANIGGIPQMYQIDMPLVGTGHVSNILGPTVSQMSDILAIPFSSDHSVVTEGLRALPGGNVLGRFGPGADKIIEKDWIE